MRKKILAVLLAVVMVLGAIPMSAMAIDAANLFTIKEVRIDGFAAAYKYVSTAPDEVRALAIKALMASNDLSTVTDSAFKAELVNIYGEELCNSKFNFDIKATANNMDYELWGTNVQKVMQEALSGKPIDQIDLDELAKCDWATEGNLLPDAWAPTLIHLLALGSFTCAVKNVDPTANFENTISVTLTEKAPEAKEAVPVVAPKEFTFETLADVQKISLTGYDAAYVYTATTSEELMALAKKAMNKDAAAKAELIAKFGEDVLGSKCNFNIIADDGMDYSLWGTNVAGFVNGTESDYFNLVECPKKSGLLLEGKEIPSYLELLALGKFVCAFKSEDDAANDGKSIKVELLQDNEVVNAQNYKFVEKPLIEVEEIYLEGYDAAYKYSAAVDADIQEGAYALAYLTAGQGYDFAEAYEVVAAEYPAFAAFAEGIGLDAFNNKYDFNVVNNDNAEYELYGTNPLTGKFEKLEGATSGKLLNDDAPSYTMLLAIGTFTCAVKSTKCNAGATITVELLENDVAVNTQEYKFEHKSDDNFQAKDGHFGKYCSECDKLYWYDQEGEEVEGGAATSNIIGTQHLESESELYGILSTTRYIVKLTDADVAAYSEIKVVFETSKGKVAESTPVDCAYTSFFNGNTEIKAENNNCVGFAIIEVATPSANGIVTAVGVDASGNETVMGTRANIFE